MKYVSTAGAASDCVFCAARAGGDDAQTFVLVRGELAFLILNAFPYASGHLMAAINRHGCSLDEATSAELTETMVLTQQAIRALRTAYHPHGFNVGVNQGRVAGAGVPDHLHVHIVPRWDGDTSFMAVVGETKVLPETLETTYGRLSAALRSLGS
jgi:ATP adenylyltransferase